jgi:hypothetical protein
LIQDAHRRIVLEGDISHVDGHVSLSNVTDRVLVGNISKTVVLVTAHKLQTSKLILELQVNFTGGVDDDSLAQLAILSQLARDLIWQSSGN